MHDLQHNLKKIKTVFFDLDGTLADTAPDLAGALNQLLEENNQSALPYAQIRPVVSYGGNALIKLAFGISEDQPRFAILREHFLELYQARLHNSTSLFPGIAEVLNTLETQNITWGVITNKPAWLTNPLMQQLGLIGRAACIICGDSTAYSKPHPAPMQLANEITNTQAKTSLYVGDAKRDIEAGQAAGMHTLVALYGYIGDEDKPNDWHADGTIQSPLEIIDWISNFNAK